MLRKILYICFLLMTGLLLGFSTATATIWEVNATSKFPSDFSNFSIHFDDDDDGMGNGDGKVYISDIIFFSGMTRYVAPSEVYSSVSRVANMSPYLGLTLIGSGSSWGFEASDGTTDYCEIMGWTYGGGVQSSGGAVPIPGAVWLLGSGLIGIVGIRRKIRK